MRLEDSRIGSPRLPANRGRRSRQEADTHWTHMLAFKGKHATRRVAGAGASNASDAPEGPCSRRVRHGTSTCDEPSEATSINHFLP